MSARARWMTLFSWWLLGLARLAVLTVPFSLISRYLGRQVGRALFSPLLDARQTQLACDIGRAVQAAARHTPWQSLCQPQVLAARFWFAFWGLPYVIYYGLQKNELGQLQAHAWSQAGRVRVTGGDALPDYVVVGSYIGPGRLAQGLGGALVHNP